MLIQVEGGETEKRNRECLFDNNNVIIENCMLFCAKNLFSYCTCHAKTLPTKEDWTWEQNYAKQLPTRASDSEGLYAIFYLTASLREAAPWWVLQDAINGKLYATINLTIKELPWNRKKAFIINKTFLFADCFAFCRRRNSYRRKFPLCFGRTIDFCRRLSLTRAKEKREKGACASQVSGS